MCRKKLFGNKSSWEIFLKTMENLSKKKKKKQWKNDIPTCIVF